MTRPRMKTWPFVAAVLGLTTTPATAGLIPISKVPVPEGLLFRHTYTVVLTTNSFLVAGDFFTLYDFGGYVPGSILTPSYFGVSVNSPTRTPAGETPTDTAAGDDFTFTYLGGDTLTGQVSLGNFSLLSTTGQTTEGFFASQTHRQVDGKPDGETTGTLVPVAGGGGSAPAATPEPATLTLAGLSLPLVLAGRFYRGRRAARAAGQ